VIVADTNVLVYFWLPGEWTPAAQRLLAVDPAWAVPLLWRSEFRNVLAAAVRERRYSLADAIAFVQGAEEQMKGRELAVESDDVLRLAVESGCSAYDCEFVALARRLAVPLVTNDRQVLKAFPLDAISLAQYAP
jgi:predicted nucleic acid-binding protein